MKLPERLAATVLARITMQPQGGWDADVVEFETKSMAGNEFCALIADAIRAALEEARQIAVGRCWEATDMVSPRSRWQYRTAKEIAEAIEALK